MSTLWLNSDGKLVVDATSGKPIICAACPCGCFPASDDFSGTGDNSGSIGDANYTDRWTDSTSTSYPTRSITAGQLHAELTSSYNTNQWTVLNNAASFDSDFTAKVDLTVSNVAGSGTPKTTPGGLLWVVIGGQTYLVGWNNSSSVSGRTDWCYLAGAGYVNYATGTGTKNIEISRVGSTYSIKFDGTTATSGTKAGTISTVQLWMSNGGSGSNRYSAHFDWDNFQLLDGSANDICIT